MNIQKKLLRLALAMLLFNASSLLAQDTIVKTNGDIILAKITEIGTNAITYKRTDIQDSPTFIQNKTEIAMIKFRNGVRQDFTEENAAKALEEQQRKSQEIVNSANQNGTNSASTSQNSRGPVNEKNKIEFLNGKYTLNGQKIGRKDVDRTLGKSKNPAVLLGLKTAKTTKTLQKIVGLTSIPTTIGGGVTTIVTMSQFITAYQTGKLSADYYLNAGLSLVGTLAFPVSSKVLKKQRDKLYDKVIDLYNVTN
jgi:hypothetical protein